MERGIIFLSILLVTVNAGPIQLSASKESKTCSRSCTGSNKFNFIEGRTYRYTYDSNIKTQIKGASEDMASLHLSANVQMEVHSKCEISMKLSDVTLTEYDPADAVMKEVSADFKAGLERFPVRVSYQDGGIEDICLSGADPTWVLNAKRGIISLFQNNMADFSRNHTVSETDVSGVCNTDYYVRESGYYTTSIGKTKNLLGCTDRHGYNTAIQGVPYTAQSDIQSLPLLKSDHECVHDIDKRSGLLKSVKCQEQHVFRPFSKSDSGAVTINTQTLRYVDDTTGTGSPAPIKARVSLKFDHVHDVEGEGNSRKDITRKLMEICERTKAGVRPETPKLFTDLVYMMKSADIDTLSDINKMLNENKLCSDNLIRTRKFFLDALPMTGTSASLHMITELITSNVITGIEADMWLTTLSFIKNPTTDMLKEVKPLINAPAISEKAMLSVGTLVHSYCFHHGNCENDNMVKAIVSAFVNKMAKGCKVKDNNLKTTLMALRGIGNAGYATNAIKQLSMCMDLRSNPIEIRLSAIEAFRRMPCGSERIALMNILQDTEEDSEIRIAAYKVLMECPSDKVLGVVRNTLAREEVNQVGSYIWTHLTNLMETSDRHKQDIRALLEDETFKKEFDLDKRKFSRNYERSAFIERINTGAKIEGDLIWSSKSFIPRSGMMNLTFDLFGHSVNLFEFGGRAEGLEYFMESFFGPNGYFRNSEADTNTKDIVPKNIRSDKMKKIDKRFSAQVDDLRGSLYMRVFGNELRYMNFKGMDSLLSGPDFNILDMLIKLSEDSDYTFTHSAMFMDSTYIVPTSSGFPLNLTVNGTATVDLKMKGKMDLRHPPTLNIAGRIQPSAAIDISSMMSVDAFVTKSGVKMVSTLHTNTALEGKISIDEKGSISSEYLMPEPRMEIIDVKSSFFTVHRDSEREQKMIEENRQTLSYCSPEKIVTITGLELCAEIDYPNASLKADAPYFPLTGPVSAGLYLYNRDTHVKYILEAKSIHNKDKNIVHFTFDTPNSRINRHVAVDFSLNKADYTLDATLTSPWKKANFQGSVHNTKKVSGISGKMGIDERLQYSLDAKLTKDVSGIAYIYTPYLEITANDKIIASSNGMLTLKKNLRQCDVEFNVDGIFTGPLYTQFSFNNKEALMGIQGSIGRSQNKQYSFNVHLATTSYKKKVLYKPLVSIRTPVTEVMALGGDVAHILGKGFDINLILDKVVDKKTTLKGKVFKAIKRRRSIYNTKLDFASGPADFSLKARFDKRAAGTLASDIDFTYIIRRVARNNLKLVSKITNQSSKTLTKAKAAINFEVKRNPELNMKLLSEISHNKKHTEIVGDIWYGSDFKDDNKHIDMRFEMNRVLKSFMNASADIDTRVRVPALNFNTRIKGSHSHDDKNLNSNLMFKFGKGQPLETSLKIKDNTDKLMKVDAEYQLALPGYDIDIEHVLEQKVDNRYVSTFKTQLKKGQKSEIVTTVLPDSRKLALNSDIKLFGKSPANLKAEFGLEPTDFVMSLSFEKDSKKYAGSITSATEIGKSSWLTLDIYHPARHMILSMKGKNEDNVIFGDAEIQYNTNQRIIMRSWFDIPTSDKLNGSFTVIAPARTVILNAHLTKGLKYLSHVDFQWHPEKKITADTEFIVKGKSVIGSAKLATPFIVLPKLAIETQLSHDSEQYNVDAKLTFEKSHTISFKAELKKPISFKTLVGSLSVKSSKIVSVKFTNLALKSISLTINHKLSNSLASDIRFGWNKQFVQTTFVLQNKTKGIKVAYDGTLDLKTSYVYMKKGKINLSHDNNGRHFITNLSFNRNKRAYKLVSKITHQPSKDSLDNSGSISVFSPYGNAESTWNHRQSGKRFATTVTTKGKFKNNLITGSFTGSFDDSINAKFDLQTPFEKLREASFEVSHSNGNGQSDSKIYLSSNGLKLGTVELGYLAEEEKYNSGFKLEIPYLNVDTQIKASADLQRNNKVTASLDASITPTISINIEASQENSKNGALTQTILLWKSSFPEYEHIQFSYKVLADDRLSTFTTLQYKRDKQIELETKFAFERTEKLAFVVIKTPFKSLSKLQGGLNISGDLDSFDTNAYIEAEPILARTAVKFSWQTTSGLKSNLRIDLPIPSYPYVQVDVTGRFSSESSEGQLKLEYMPEEVIDIEGSYTHTGSELMVNGKVASPYGKFVLHQSSKLNEFTCKLSLEDSKIADFSIAAAFTNKDKISVTTTISVAGRRDVNVVFTHSGDIVSFDTHAQVQHNKKNNFISDLSFSAHENIKVSFTASLRAQAISDTEEYEGAFNFNGVPLKFNTHGEFSTTSLGKSQTDISFDMKSALEGSFILKSKLMKNVKASFSHFRRNDYIESNVDIIHGGQKIVDIQANINSLESLIFEFKCKTPFLKDMTFMTRIDGNITNFVIRSEGAYGTTKADADLTSKVDTKILRQQIRLSATGIPDISAEFNHNGDLWQLKSYGEINVGTEKHRLDIAFNSQETTEGSFSIESPLLVSYSGNVQVSGSRNDFRSHADLTVGKDISSADIIFTFTSIKDATVEANFRSPFAKDFSIRLSNIDKAQTLELKCLLSIEGLKEFDLKLTSTKQPLSIMFALKTPLENFSSFETSFNMKTLKRNDKQFHFDYTLIDKSTEIDVTYSQIKGRSGQLSIKSHLIPETSVNFEHEGVLLNFRGHADYNFGGKKSEIEASFNSMDRLEGFLEVKSHLIPDLSVGFEHDGTLNNFKSHGELSIGTNKRKFDISLNVEDAIAINMQYTCPVHGLSTASFTHHGKFEDFKCHAEIQREGIKWEGDASFSSVNNIRGILKLRSTPPSEFEPITLSFEQTGTAMNFRSNGEIMIGNDKTTHELTWMFTDSLVSTNLKIESPYIRDVSANFKLEGQPKNIKVEAGFIFGLQRLNTDFTWRLKKSSLDSSFSLSSSLCSDITGSFNLQGKSNDFSSKIHMKINNKENSGYFSFRQKTTDIKTLFEVKSAYIEDIRVELQHSGDLYQFKTNYTSTIFGSQNTASMTLDLIDNMHGEISLDKPTIIVKGTFEKGVFNALLKKASDEYSVSFSYLINEAITINCKIITPFSGYKTVTASYEHSGNLNNFKCSGNLEIERALSVFNLKIDTEKLTNLTCSLDITSPYVLPVNLKISNTANSGKYISVLDFRRNNQRAFGLYASATNDKMKYTREGSVVLTFDNDEHKVLDISTSPSGFDISSEILNKGKSNKVDITFSKSPKLIATLNLDSELFPVIQAHLDFDGTPYSFVGSCDLNVDGRQSGHITVSLNTVDKIDATFNMELPFIRYRELNGDFLFVPGDNVFKFEAKMTNKISKLFDVSLNYETNNFDFVLESNTLHPLSASASYSNVDRNIKISWEIIHASQNLINGKIDIIVKFKPVYMSGLATINTQFGEFSSKIHIDPNSQNLNVEATHKQNSETWSVLGRLDFSKDIDAEIRLTIPNMDDVKGTLVHSVRPYKSITNAELRLNATHYIGYDMEMKWRKGLEGNFELKTPFEGFEKVILKSHHEGSFPNMKSSAEFQIAEKVIAATAAFLQKESMKADFTLSTPFKPYENLALSMFHEGVVTSFRTGGRLVYVVGEEIEVNIDHMWVGTTHHSKARFMSPYTDEIVVSANHTGHKADFSSAYEMAIGKNVNIISKTSMKLGENFLAFSNEMSSRMSGEFYEQKIELNHVGKFDNFKTEASVQSLDNIFRMETSFRLDPVIEGSFEFTSPIANFQDIKASFSHSGSANSILTTGDFQFAPKKKISGKIDMMQYGLKRMVANIELMTPFENMKQNKLSYKHSSDSDSIQCEIDSLIYGNEITGTLSGSKSPFNIELDIKTPFKGFETIGLNGQFDTKKKHQYFSKLHAQLNPTRLIDIEGSISSKNVEIYITSTIEEIRDASIMISEKQLAKGFLESVKIIHNGNSLVDFDVEHSLLPKNKYVHINTRAPRTMKFEVDGEFSLPKTVFDVEANWNTEDINSKFSAEISYDIKSQKSANVKVKHSKLPGKQLTFSALINGRHSKAYLSWGMNPDNKAGYEFTIGEYDGTMKLVLPSRSLELHGSHRGTTTEGSFKWDADVDQSKKVAIKSQTVSASDTSKVSIVITMPSLGKNVQVGSEISLNKGRVIFDGKTVLAYSGDSRKKLVFSSKLEDISMGGSQNYSLSFGLSHPYTTLGVTVNTHAGRSKTGYTAGVGLEYLTVKEQIKKFHIGAKIDKLMKAVSFELQSPIKSISISGSAQNNDKFRLSLLNIYDQKQPLSTIFTFDPTSRSIDFVTNFDEDHPKNEFHVNMKYVNSSALSAEVSHSVRRDTVQDILVTAQLNTSHIFHSRIHWRPQMMKDLEDYLDRKLDSYNMRLRKAAAKIEPEIVEEVTEKFRKIWNAVEEEIGKENIAAFEAAVVPYLDLALQHTTAMTKPFVQRILVILMQSRNTDMPQYPVTLQLPSESLNSKYISSLKEAISDKFDLVSEKIKLPAKHMPMFVSRVMSDAMTYTTEQLPAPVASQMIVLKSYGVIDALESYIKEEILAIEKEAETKLRYIEEIIMSHMKSPFTVYDPAHGEIQMEFYSIIPIRSLDSLPSLNVMRSVEKLKALKTSLLNSLPDISLPDISGEWMPPFTGVATILYGHKITTFDGYVYDLNSDCTYILTRDYRDGNFTLVLSNDGYPTLTVLSSGKPISINLQGEILLDGKPANVPFTEGYISVTQGENSVVTIQGGNHFSVDYDLTIDRITIQISGWYHGKTGGLLGVYDNEPSNDKMTSFNKVVDNNGRFAKTWEVGTNSCS